MGPRWHFIAAVLSIAMQRVPQVDRRLDDVRAYRRIALDTNVVIYLLEEIAIYSVSGQLCLIKR